MELADRVGGIKPRAEVVADVEAEAHARVEVLHHLEGTVAGGEAVRDVRAVVVDRHADVVLPAEGVERLAAGAARTALLLPVHHAVLVGHGHEHLHAHGLGVVEIPARLVLLEVDRPHAVARDAVVGALLVERADVRRRRLERQVEVLDAQVVDIERLQVAERFVQRAAVERVARHTECERDLRGRTRRRGGGRTERPTAGRKQRQRARTEEQTAIHHDSLLPSSCFFKV